MSKCCACPLTHLCELNVQVACSMREMGNPQIEDRKGHGCPGKSYRPFGGAKAMNITSNIQPICIPAICCAQYIDIYPHVRDTHGFNITQEISDAVSRPQEASTLSRQVQETYLHKRRGQADDKRNAPDPYVERRSCTSLATSCLAACSCLSDLLSAFLLGRGRRQGGERAGGCRWRKIFNLCVWQDDRIASMRDFLS
jgi:hypothetical protein